MNDPLCSERGSGSIVAIAAIGGTLAAIMIALSLYSVVPTKHAIASAADAAALVAANTASGRLEGDPCARAAALAAQAGASLTSCQIDDATALVTVSRSILGVTVAVSARAGPPP